MGYFDVKSTIAVASDPGAVKRIVYVIDDDIEMLQSLKFLLQTSRIWAETFASASDFLGKLSTLQPAPILVDLRMPEMSGLDLLDELRSRKIAWPIVLLTGHGDVAVAVEAIKRGAIDFLEKPIDMDLIEPALEGGFAALKKDGDSYTDRATACARFARLTQRQSEVIEELMRGKSNKQVALDLSVSSRTVEMHRAAALNKLGIRTVAEAVTLRTLAN
jgi:two-component system response regulator FixJ